jgi:4-diphosphocytidyl-2-C-methyl-D-erythritol kinase
LSVAALWDVVAPAKVNLFLHVVGRRGDGYHLLQSVSVLIDWFDTLHFERRVDGRLRRHDLAAALPPDDLIVRAARALQAASGVSLGADISVEKRVPSGAGLGGGSSYAASTLLALNRLWGLGWPRERLLELALPLGADVPFFVGGHNAWVEGVGERLTPFAVPPMWVAVVKPAGSVSTAVAFSGLRDVHLHDADILPDFLADAGLPQKLLNGYGRNDLQPIVQRLCPEVAQVAGWLEARYGNSRMSGSGSAVFSRAGTGDRPSAAWSVDELPPRWVGRMCHSLPVHPLAGWAD